MILIPAAMLSNKDIAFWQHLLSHELAHIRRHDHWFVWLEFAGMVVWWWNPLFWLVRQRLRSTAEMAADAWAVSLSPHDRREYAEALLWVAERASRVGPALPALGASRRSHKQFTERLTLIVCGRHRVRVFMPAMLGILLLVVYGVIEVLFALPPEWGEAKFVLYEFVRGLSAPGAVFFIFALALGAEERWRSFAHMPLPGLCGWEAFAGATLGTLVGILLGPDLIPEGSSEIVGALFRLATIVGAIGLLGVGSAAGSLALTEARRHTATSDW